MIAFFQKNKWLILAAFVGGILLPKVLGSTLQTNLFANLDTPEDAIVAYHLKANEITNQFLDGVMNSEDPDVSSVDSESDCGDQNFSTFCLAAKLNANLLEFEEAIAAKADDVSGFSNGGSADLSTVIKAANERQNLVDLEVGSARDTLDLTLAVYNQVQLVYPMHKELVNLTYSLEAFRDNLADLRSRISLYPSKFNDASTAKCQ